MPSSSPLLMAPVHGSVMHFVLTTTPFLAVLIYFLYQAYQRPSLPIYADFDEVDYDNEQWRAVNDATGPLIPLTSMLKVFLVLLVLWATFAVYTIVFIPKRRHLIGRYLTEGEVSIGDVYYDNASRKCGNYNDYGYAVYTHPKYVKKLNKIHGDDDSDDDESQKKKKNNNNNELAGKQGHVVRKRVRVYQNYTRERVTILRIPDMPLSGQCKIDIEIDLASASKERDTRNQYIAGFSVLWVIFCLVAPIYIIYQMKDLNDPLEDYDAAKKLYIIVAGSCIPFAYLFNAVRWLMYRNWMLNRGAIVPSNDITEPESIGCLMSAPSIDGTDVVPYAMFEEDGGSFLGTLPSHAKRAADAKAAQEAQQPWVNV